MRSLATRPCDIFSRYLPDSDPTLLRLVACYANNYHKLLTFTQSLSSNNVQSTQSFTISAQMTPPYNQTLVCFCSADCGVTTANGWWAHTDRPSHPR
jgi:hypothetical protein